MSNPTFKDHFSTGSSSYAAHRPTYPKELVEELAKLAPSLDTALDCGCGTGQLSVLLADCFASVVATDASAAQIEQAEARARVSYRVAPAESSGLEDSSVDLITVAQAAHWLDLKKFYVEVKRVAKPQAIIALITYGVMDIGDAALSADVAVDNLAKHFYHDVIGKYWPPERRFVEEGYKSFEFPFVEIEMPKMAIEVSWALDDAIGYMNTWSAVKAASQALGQNPVNDFRFELAKIWGSAELRRKVRWELGGRLGRVLRAPPKV